jgi:hypothetical protein
LRLRGRGGDVGDEVAGQLIFCSEDYASWRGSECCSLSLTVAFAAEWVLTWLAVTTVGVQAAPTQWVLPVAAFALGIGINTLPAMALLTAPPRLRLPLRR